MVVGGDVVVVVVVPDDATPIVSTTLLFGSTWVPGRGALIDDLADVGVVDAVQRRHGEALRLEVGLGRRPCVLPISPGSATVCAPLDT